VFLLLILLTSLAGTFGTWYVTAWVYGSGLPHTSLLVGLAIALAWAIAYERLEEFYLAGDFERVRRMLALWKSSMGKGETQLLQLWMAIEAQDEDAYEALLVDMRPTGLHGFAQIWGPAQRLRLAGDLPAAIALLRKGLEGARGLNRAELLCEIARLDLSQSQKGAAEDRAAALESARSVLHEVDHLITESEPGSGGMARLRYVSTLYQFLRALVHQVQGDSERALRHFSRVIADCRQLSSLRGRRLAQAARIERLLAVRTEGGEEDYTQEFTDLLKTARLPGLRTRLSEIEALVEADRARLRAEEEARRQREASGEVAAEPIPVIDMDISHVSLFETDAAERPRLEKPLAETSVAESVAAGEPVRSGPMFGGQIDIDLFEGLGGELDLMREDDDEA
jgi:hypothetical protein